MSNEMVYVGEDGWDEISGEQSGGGRSAEQILGEMARQSPALRSYLQKQGVKVTKQPYLNWQDWQIDFGPVSGAASTTTTITNTPQCLFQGIRVMATDDGGSKTAGYNTRIQGIVVGQANQRPAAAGSGTLTAFFANTSVGSDIKWKTCQRGLSISVTVSFVTASTFEMSVFGKAVL